MTSLEWSGQLLLTPYATASLRVKGVEYISGGGGGGADSIGREPSTQDSSWNASIRLIRYTSSLARPGHKMLIHNS